jgi:hypothetical protein
MLHAEQEFVAHEDRAQARFDAGSKRALPRAAVELRIRSSRRLDDRR